MKKYGKENFERNLNNFLEPYLILLDHRGNKKNISSV